MASDKLPHTARIEKLLQEGKRQEAERVHTEHVDAELERSKSGPINLSDLMAGHEAFHMDDIRKAT